MSDATRTFVLTLAALVLAGALLLTDRTVPEWLYLAVGALLGGIAIRRPGDVDASRLESERDASSIDTGRVVDPGTTRRDDRDDVSRSPAVDATRDAGVDGSPSP